jgi:hypothetical protein
VRVPKKSWKCRYLNRTAWAYSNGKKVNE